LPHVGRFCSHCGCDRDRSQIRIDVFRRPVDPVREPQSAAGSGHYFYRVAGVIFLLLVTAYVVAG